MIVELKAVENLIKIFEIQIINYLAATGLDVGLLVNFGSSVTVKRKYRTYTPKNNPLN
jgi:GxxExxY protein